MSIEAQRTAGGRAERQTRPVKVLEDVSVAVEGSKVLVKGPLGGLEKDFSHLPVQISVQAGEVAVSTDLRGRRGRAVLGTSAKHILNMMRGTRTRHVAKMVAVHSHFPMTMKVVQNGLLIENFVGERYPRYVNIPRGVEVKVDGDNLQIAGMDIEKVTQTAGAVERVTSTMHKDSRVFLDGIYILEKGFENEHGR